VLEKILLDEAQGIILVPVWPSRIWFHVLSRIAVRWWDLPKGEPIFLSISEKLLPPTPWFVRVVVFNAFEAHKRINNGSPWYTSIETTTEQHLVTCNTLLNSFYEDEFVPQQPLMAMPYIPPKYPVGDDDQSRIANTGPCPSGLADCLQAALYGVIASADPCATATQRIAEITRDYGDVLNTPQLARDVNPSTRGPYGVAKIVLKDGARPSRKPPFRMIGEREDAMKVFVDKFLARGWITPTKSEWAAQAFVVSKPPDQKNPNTKQWRMVVDYRYLNSQTRDDCYPLPLIDDLIVKQSKNRIWSIFDLEYGFHQMHLDESSRHLTSFVTTFGAYEFTVLPMGVKNGPSMLFSCISMTS